jgi:hypothetical protein
MHKNPASKINTGNAMLPIAIFTAFYRSIVRPAYPQKIDI